MFALAINGSPRKNGNTQAMLEKVLNTLQEQGWETELEQVGGKTIKGCVACNTCFKKANQRCAFDDAFNPIFEKMLKADAIIIGSPTYFTDVTAETKALIDRAGFVSMANDCALKAKIGAAAIAVRRGGATHAFDTINHLYMISRMIIPGSTYWNMGYGLRPGEVKEDEEAMENMGHLGLAIDWLGKAIHAHKSVYPTGHKCTDG